MTTMRFRLKSHTTLFLTLTLLCSSLLASADDATTPPLPISDRHVAQFARSPEQATEWFSKFSVEQRLDLIPGLITRWTKRDPKSATSWVATLANGYRFPAMTTLTEARGRKDPVATWQWLSSLPLTEQEEIMARHRNVLSYLALAWAEKDSVAASKWADTLCPEHRNAAARAILIVWSETDPAAAWHWAQTLTEANELTKTIDVQTVWDNWGRKDPGAACKAIATLHRPSRERAVAVYCLLRNWAEKNPSAALKWFEQLSRDEQKSACTAIPSNWARRNPKAAAAWASKLPFDSERSTCCNDVAREWALKQPAAAAHWAQTLPEDERTEALVAVGKSWAETDPKAAWNWLLQLPPKTRNRCMESVANNWVKKDLAGARRWIESLPAEDQNTARKALPSTTTSQQEPDSSWPGLPNIEDEASHWKAVDLARIDLTLARQWALGLREKRQRLTAIKSVACVWADRDPKAAADWYLSTVDTNQNLSLFQPILKQWAEKDFGTAWAWLKNLSAEDRDKLYPAILIPWSALDLEAASNWFLEQSNRQFVEFRELAEPQAAKGDPALCQLALAVAQAEQSRTPLFVPSPTCTESLLEWLVEKWPEEKTPFLANSFHKHDPPLSAAVIKILLRKWGSIAPSRALTWAQQQPATEQPTLIPSILDGWQLKNPADALAWWIKHPNHTSDTDFLECTMYSWAQSDPGAALDWCHKQLPAADQPPAFSGIAGGWSFHAPRSVATWVATLAVDQREKAVIALMEHWAIIEPQKAWEWLLTIHATPRERSESIRAATFGFSRGEPRIAIQWAETLTKTERNETEPSLIYGWICNMPPQEAWAWLQRIYPILKEPLETIRALTLRWNNYSPRTVRQWVQTLPENERMAAEAVLKERGL